MADEARNTRGNKFMEAYLNLQKKADAEGATVGGKNFNRSQTVLMHIQADEKFPEYFRDGMAAAGLDPNEAYENAKAIQKAAATGLQGAKLPRGVAKLADEAQNFYTNVNTQTTTAIAAQGQPTITDKAFAAMKRFAGETLGVKSANAAPTPGPANSMPPPIPAVPNSVAPPSVTAADFLPKTQTTAPSVEGSPVIVAQAAPTPPPVAPAAPTPPAAAPAPNRQFAERQIEKAQAAKPVEPKAEAPKAAAKPGEIVHMPEEVKRLQQAAGLKGNDVDGMFGSKTAAALRAKFGDLTKPENLEKLRKENPQVAKDVDAINQKIGPGMFNQDKLPPQGPRGSNAAFDPSKAAYDPAMHGPLKNGGQYDQRTGGYYPPGHQQPQQQQPRGQTVNEWRASEDRRDRNNERGYSAEHDRYTVNRQRSTPGVTAARNSTYGNYQRADLDGDGRVSRQERMIDRADRNRDGVLSQREQLQLQRDFDRAARGQQTPYERQVEREYRREMAEDRRLAGTFGRAARGLDLDNGRTPDFNPHSAGRSLNTGMNLIDRLTR